MRRLITSKRLITSLASLYLAVVSFLAPLPANADNIDSLLDQIVSSSYYAPPGEIKSPTNNTYTLGSYSFRLNNNLLNMPVFNINPPQATLSCAGGDFNAGMIGMLNLNALKNMLTQAGTSLAWGIMIGLVYSLPGIGDAFQKLNEWAREWQRLGANACLIGTELGAKIGRSIFENAKDKSVEKTEASNQTSSFTSELRHFAEDLLNTGEVNKLFGDIPYGPLFDSVWPQAILPNPSSGSTVDSHTADLIASLFGVLDWKAVDSSGNVCSDTSCLKNARVRVTYYHPLPNDLMAIMNGGNVQVYQCDWGYNSNVNAWMCQNAITPETITISEGLRQKVYNRIDTIVTDIANGGYTPSPGDAQWIESVPLPNFADILNYLAVLKIQGNTDPGYTSQYQSALYGVSELVAAFMLKGLVDDIYQVLYTEGAYLEKKDSPQKVEKAMETAYKVREELDNYIQKYMQANYIAIEETAKTYDSLKSAEIHSFFKNFGSTASLFMGQ